MNVVLRYVICGGLVSFFAAFSLHAQDSAPKAEAPFHLSNDDCGNPAMESQSWTLVKGVVSEVIDGRTLMVTLPHNSHPLRVYLVGVGLGTREQATAQAKELLSQLLRDKPVEILTNPDFARKQLAEITGVVHIEKFMAGLSDVGLILLSKGLVKFREPAPYSMSLYTECRYKHAEADARAKKLGLWANGE
jgi:endonuclease YncB( thermonuclease family)